MITSTSVCIVTMIFMKELMTIATQATLPSKTCSILCPSELARILKNVYPFPDNNDDTVLHHIASHTGLDSVFLGLFPHFPEYWFFKNWKGLIPMAIIWRCKYNLNYLFQAASNNPEFFALLARN